MTNKVPLEKYGVHKRHCCLHHGCKYGDMGCPVASGEIIQDYPCEDCVETPLYSLMTQKEYLDVASKYLTWLKTNPPTIDINQVVTSLALFFFKNEVYGDDIHEETKFQLIKIEETGKVEFKNE